MELNAEQIKKALERDIRISIDLNYECPRITYSKLRDALALITSQEQRIKKLTEELQKLKKVKYIFSTVDYCADDLAKALEENKKLTEENERLRENNLVFAHGVEKVAANYYNLGCTDTVRKMQERLKEYFPYDADSGLYVVIDQIAKEMLEGEKQ